LAFTCYFWVIIFNFNPIRKILTIPVPILSVNLSLVSSSCRGILYCGPNPSTGYEEDEEYEDTETETNDEDYGEGFGPQYNMPLQEEDTSERLTDNIGTGMVKIFLIGLKLNIITQK
jgi:hypothetical protein